MDKQIKLTRAGVKKDWVVDFAPLTNSRDDAESDWLVTGDTLTTYVVTVPTGVTLTTSALTDGNTSVTLWLTPTVPGTKYPIQVDIGTIGGREEQIIFDLLVEI